MKEHEIVSLLEELEAAAVQRADGHYTLMRFTTNWRCGLKTPTFRQDIDAMHEGKTMEEAIQKCLNSLGL